MPNDDFLVEDGEADLVNVLPVAAISKDLVVLILALRLSANEDVFDLDVMIHSLTPNKLEQKKKRGERNISWRVFDQTLKNSHQTVLIICSSPIKMNVSFDGPRWL